MFEFIFACALIGLSVLSWGFVNIHSPYSQIPALIHMIYFAPRYTTILYVALFTLLFFAYVRILGLVKAKKISLQHILRYITIAVVVLFFGFPGFSYDVFNYMATARVTYTWGENPYIVMPIEISNEPILTYMQAANKVALYGPSWIAITSIPHSLGMNNPLITLYLFKLIEVLFYIGTLILIWRISNRRLWALAFFALNPIVLSEVILSGHNDIVMIFFALLAFYLLQKKKYFLSVLAMLLSVFVKYATILLIPIFLVAFVRERRSEKNIWETIWLWSALAMYLAFILSPIREEIYGWYFVWPLAFVSLLPDNSFLVWLSYGFTFGLPFRFAPYILTQSYAGQTPLIKKIVTFVPPVISGLFYAFRKKV